MLFRLIWEYISAYFSIATAMVSHITEFLIYWKRLFFFHKKWTVKSSNTYNEPLEITYNLKELK